MASLQATDTMPAAVYRSYRVKILVASGVAQCQEKSLAEWAENKSLQSHCPSSAPRPR